LSITYRSLIVYFLFFIVLVAYHFFWSKKSIKLTTLHSKHPQRLTLSAHSMIKIWFSVQISIHSYSMPNTPMQQICGFTYNANKPSFNITYNRILTWPKNVLTTMEDKKLLTR
jgi:hypothetical protein